jgi:hypothetical protein
MDRQPLWKNRHAASRRPGAPIRYRAASIPHQTKNPDTMMPGLSMQVAGIVRHCKPKGAGTHPRFRYPKPALSVI